MENITLQQISDLLDSRLNLRFEAFGKEIDKKLDARFEAFEKRMDTKMDSRFEKNNPELESRIIQKVTDALNYRFDQNDKDHDRMFKEIFKINDRLDVHETKISNLQGALISSINNKKLNVID